jgi:hypothetical protein
MTLARAASVTQVSALVTVPQRMRAAARAAQVVALVSYAPPGTRQTQASQITALAAYKAEGRTVPATSQIAALVCYRTGIPDQARSLAWTFTLDGHCFYVLNLGPEGTFLYDVITKQWCKFDTQGYGQWNFINGCMWGIRTVGGDSITNQVWELVPTALLDEGWRDIAHAATGAISLRSRTFVGCDALRVSASFGDLDDVNGASISMRFSDDWGNTWSEVYTISLTEGDFSGEIVFRSLGSFMAPGRIFELTDSGGLIRIDGVDAFLNGFDNDQQNQGDSQGE